MVTLYEFKVKEMCKNNSPEKLAEMAINFEGTYKQILQEIKELKAENEILLSIIAKNGMVS